MIEISKQEEMMGKLSADDLKELLKSCRNKHVLTRIVDLWISKDSIKQFLKLREQKLLLSVIWRK